MIILIYLDLIRLSEKKRQIYREGYCKKPRKIIFLSLLRNIIIFLLLTSERNLNRIMSPMDKNYLEYTGKLS